jgi:hypothetical protein
VSASLERPTSHDNLAQDQTTGLPRIDSYLEAKVLLAAPNISCNGTQNVSQPVREAFNKIAKNFWDKLIPIDKKSAVQVDMLPIATDKRKGAQYLSSTESRALAAVRDADKRSVGLKAVPLQADQRVVINQNLLGMSTKSNKWNRLFTAVHEVGPTLRIDPADDPSWSLAVLAGLKVSTKKTCGRGPTKAGASPQEMRKTHPR